MHVWGSDDAKKIRLKSGKEDFIYHLVLYSECYLDLLNEYKSHEWHSQIFKINRSLWLYCRIEWKGRKTKVREVS